MKPSHNLLSILAVLFTLFSLNISFAGDLKSGEQVYKMVCFACHANKVPNAPQYNSKSDWKKLVSEGQYVVTAHGWVGVRGMPAKGGRADLKLEEFARATAYMARSAGADWKDPDAGAMKKIVKEVEKRKKELGK